MFDSVKIEIGGRSDQPENDSDLTHATQKQKWNVRRGSSMKHWGPHRKGFDVTWPADRLPFLAAMNASGLVFPESKNMAKLVKEMPLLC